MSEVPKTRENPQARANQLDFLYDLYLKGINIGEENIQKLKTHGYFKEFTEPLQAKIVEDVVNRAALSLNTDRTRKADALIDIAVDKKPEFLFEIITNTELEERRKRYGHIFEGRQKPILRHEWLPNSTTTHEQDFIDWINSINRYGFTKRIYYRPFALYCQQAYGWLQENKDSADFDDDDEREDYRQEELRRCDDSALYFLNKYGWYKEADADDESGKVRYVATAPHEFMAFLDDCGYSAGIAKGRQMAATTTLMLLDVRDVVFKTNHFMKFITEDDEKAVEIFEDKLKFAFGELPDWMRPNVLNERDNMFKIGYKTEKGKKEGVGSKIAVVVPKRTAIAGGAPNKVKIDEAGNIPILGKMIGNARPTMYFFNKKTQTLVLKRKLWFWGTGGEMEKGGKAFETEFMAIQTAWDKGDYSPGIIPIFFDWRCRPGASQEIYDREKEIAYRKGEDTRDPDAKQHITEFHQTYPNSLSDVFRTSARTLVDDDYIQAALERIDNAQAQRKDIQLVHYGYFEPIYDESRPTDEGSDVPFKIIGATFVPTGDLDPRITVAIFMHPKKDWVNRYFQGTDPIDTNSGQSNFASAIWDKDAHTLSAILNFRVSDYQQVFLQSLLMGLYYDPESKYGVPELVESNRGTSYTQYKTQKGFLKNMVINSQLPDFLVNNSTINEGVGVDNKGQRNIVLINRMTELLKFYGTHIYIRIVFQQLKTFVCKISATGKEVWGPINRKYFMDDTLWALDFSYICAELVFPHLKPKNIQQSNSTFVIKSKMVRDKHSLKLKRVYEKVAVSDGR